MNKFFSLPRVFGLVFLFFIQSAGTLVESIYILDLLNTRLDEKALGVLFFFTPVLLIPFYRKYPREVVWLCFGTLFFARGLLPYLSTSNRLIAAGLGVFASLTLFFLLLNAKAKDGSQSRLGGCAAVGLAIAIGLSALLRALGSGLDYSLVPSGSWVGWLFGLGIGWDLMQLSFANPVSVGEKKPGVTGALIGIFMIFTLIWFAFSAPAVIARWTEGNYLLVVLAISLLAAGWGFLSFARAGWFERISPSGLLLWNILFTLSLTATILVHSVPFPPTPDSAPVVVTSPSLLAQIPLVVMLLLFPVIFFDLRLFLDQIQQTHPAPAALIPGILLGALVMVALVFAQIFTNVWGYVEPVSPFFRGKFWLPYFVMAGVITLLAWQGRKFHSFARVEAQLLFSWQWTGLTLALGLLPAIWLLPQRPIQVDAAEKTSLVVMTFNTQQSNDRDGEKSFERQLALIREVSPDVLALQESDSTRVSLNNNDYVRYFAENLGYYSYYGPTTITGTYGTAILSKYPLLNTRTVFTYSSQDEIGIAEAEIEVNGRTFTIYNVHPDGSDTSMLTFAETLLERSKDKPHVIALGDYNLRDYEEAYQLVDSAFTNAWVTIYPSEISADGVDMSGDNRIDHIFVSPDLTVRSAFYVLPPESATDHPVHWAEITWIDQ